MAGFRKHRRPPSVTAHVCHRLQLPTGPRQQRRLSDTLGQTDFVESRATQGFWTVKRRPLPPAKIHSAKPELDLDRAIQAVQQAGVWPRDDGDKYRKQVDLLERRLAKVNGLLENNELEIKRLRRLKTADTGVASKFKDVQGIADDDQNAEAKKEMMSQIFSANLKLHQRISSQSSSSD